VLVARSGSLSGPTRGTVYWAMAGDSGEAGNEALGGVQRLRSVCCCHAPPLQLRGFFSVTPVQQSLLLLLGSLAYDAGSVACVPCAPGWRQLWPH